eukprot:TRINITY_DN161_c0_g1_i1.p1 TRINITY_DN161_c0_g1~~TRINITY_DN161_c0_g1_i1.p1  ORF type:complete len:342 (+),score=53.98 TRINITY_DN161_c0_g1_i1:99-1124(+)
MTHGVVGEEKGVTRMRFKVTSSNTSSSSSKEPVERATEGAVSRLKGLENEVDAYHCFLNVCLQGCLHLDGVREVLIETAHSCEGEGCVLCEVRYVIQSASRIRASYLSPVLVRAALHGKVGKEVQPNKMADAVEVFWMLFGEMQKTLPKNAFLGIFPDVNYMLNAQRTITMQDVSAALLAEQPEGAPSITHSLYPIQVIWRNYPPYSQDLQTDLVSFASLLQARLHLHNVSPHLYKTVERFATLKGFIAYYPGMHYTAVFKLPGEGSPWVHFDDTLISPISPDWADVVSFIARGKHMPVMLFYERDEIPSEDGWVEVEAPMPGGTEGGAVLSPEGRGCVVS